VILIGVIVARRAAGRGGRGAEERTSIEEPMPHSDRQPVGGSDGERS
jgi:hypothetical protein